MLDRREHLIFTPMTETRASAIVAWRYEEPYAFYDMDQDPDDVREFLDADTWGRSLFAVVDGQGELIGDCSYKQNGDTVAIGLGLRPDLTGQGLGLAFVLAGLDFARQEFSPRRFLLSVALFNRRAQLVYERAGFQPIRTKVVETNGSSYEFVDMVRLA